MTHPSFAVFAKGGGRSTPGQVRTDEPVTVVIDGMRLVNTLNAREDWRVRMRREKAEKARVRMRMPRVPVSLPCVVTMTRLYSKRSKEMDDDGLAAAMKAPRDSVADWLGTDDSSRGGVTWVPKQAPSDSASNYLIIHVEPAAAAGVKP